jgi:hypothetical protein
MSVWINRIIVSQMTGETSSDITLAIHRGLFPKPGQQLFGDQPRWRLSVITAWVRNNPRGIDFDSLKETIE